MNYLESDNKELQETWEQLSRAVSDLESSDSLTEMEREQKAQLVRRLNRRYDVLSNRVKIARLERAKMDHSDRLTKFIVGVFIGFSIGLLWIALRGW